MKLEDVKITDSTTNQQELESFLKEGWAIIGSEEFMEGDPPLKKTKWNVGHDNGEQRAPEWIIKVRKIIVEALKS